MADDKEPEAGDDPWADLESEQLPDLTEGFAFSFEESAAPGDQPDDAPTAELPAKASGSGGVKEEADHTDVDEWLEGPEEATPAPELSVFQSEDEEVRDEADLSSEPVTEQSSIGIGAGTSEADSPSNVESSESAEAQEDFGGGEDPFAAAIAAELFASDSPEESAIAAAAAADEFEPGAEEIAESDDAEGNAGGMFSFTDGEAADAPSIDDAGGTEEPEAFAFPVEDGEVASLDEVEDSGAPMIAATAVAATAGQPKGNKGNGKKSPRPAPARKKKPSMVGQMIGMVVGGAMSIPIVLLILWWGAGMDTFKVAPMVPDSLSFILPPKFRSGGQIAVTAGSGRAPTLDDVLGGGSGPSPDDTDVAVTDPEPSVDLEPVLPEPEISDPSDSDLATVDLPPDSGSDDDDPLMALLREDSGASPEPSLPPAPPAPEPLDIAALEAAADKAIAAFAAVVDVDDPSDPVHKKLLVECYRSLAAYAQELVMLERVAADSGRPLETMPAPVAAMHEAISSKPELFDALARLTRDWLAYSRRSSDGVVVPATFLAARPVGPYWRAEVNVGERPLVVLTRAEPAVARGEMVLVTGLTVDKDVVWATDVRPAKAPDAFGL